MLIETWSQALSQSFYGLWGGVIDVVPKIVAAIIIFVLGWIIASVIEKLVAQIFKVIMVDKALKSAGLEDSLARGGIRLDSGMFIGALVKWFIVIIFLMASLEVVGLNQVNEFLGQIVGYLPQVIISALVLLVAAVVANAADRVVTSMARTAGISSAGFLGGVSRWAIWIFAIMTALTQLGIAGQLMFILLQGVVAMLAISGGLAFGLGGKDAAARYIERLRDEISSKKN
ncbi:MAG: hypothetical protein AAB428_03740 [Patescibacteria group bacterium]